MKDTIETRLELTRRMNEGKLAEGLLKSLDPKFVELRELYRSNLVHSVRQKEGADSVYQDACRIAALEDLYQALYNDAVTGANALKTATKLESEATK